MILDSTSIRMLAPRVIAGGFVLALAVALYLRWIAPPQMGADPETFRTVDALFTAVTARDEKLLANCEHRLKKLDDAGKMEGSSGAYLGAIVESARSGNWDGAARRLYAFMDQQKREGDRSAKKDTRRARS